MNILFIAVIGAGAYFLPKARIMNYLQIFDVYFELAYKYANVYNVPVKYVLAVIKQESSGNMLATGSTGDYGLMQITKPALIDYNLATGKNYNLFTMLISAKKNLEVGTWYLKWCKKFLNSNWYDAFRAYNAGVGNVKRSDKAGKSYADSVMTHVFNFENLLKEVI